MAVIARRKGDLFYGRGLTRVTDSLHDAVIAIIESRFPEIKKISRRMLDLLAANNGVIVVGKGKVILDAAIDCIDSQGSILVRIGFPIYGKQSSVDSLLKSLIDRFGMKFIMVDGGRLSVELQLNDDRPVEIFYPKYPKAENGNGQKSFVLLSEFSGMEPK